MGARIGARIPYCSLQVDVMENVLFSDGKTRFGLQWSDFDFQVTVAGEDCRQQSAGEVSIKKIAKISWHASRVYDISGAELFGSRQGYWQQLDWTLEHVMLMLLIHNLHCTLTFQKYQKSGINLSTLQSALGTSV